MLTLLPHQGPCTTLLKMISVWQCFLVLLLPLYLFKQGLDITFNNENNDCRWNSEAATFVRLLARCRAQAVPALSRTTCAYALALRRSASMSIAATRAFAARLPDFPQSVGRPPHGHQGRPSHSETLHWIHPSAVSSCCVCQLIARSH